jgi:uncharacterized RDD family membrane protein YckC
MAAIDRARAAHDDFQRIEAAPFLVQLGALVVGGLLALVLVTLLTGEGGVVTRYDMRFGFPTAVLALPVKFLPVVAVLALLEGFTGRTIGKALMGLHIVGVEDGEPIGLLRAIGRRGFMVLESYVYFVPSLLLVPFNGNFDGHIGDRLTGAIVARDRDIRRAFPAHPRAG